MRHSAPLPLVRIACVAVALLFAVLVLPSLLDAYWLSTGTAAAIFVLPVAGIALLYGRLAIVSMCSMALFAIGGWTALRLSFATDLPFLVIAACAGVVTCAAGLVIGLPTLRLSGLYFALVSLMAAAAIEVLLIAKGFPNGGPGFFGVTDASLTPKAMARPSLAITDVAYFRYAVVVVAALVAVLWLHYRGRPGRAWATIRQSPAAAQSVGIRVGRYKLWAIALSSFVTGVGGALLAGNIQTLDASGFSAADSLVLFAVTLLGGAFSLFGAVLGGVFSQVIPAVLEKLSLDGNTSLLVFGLGVMFTLATAPAGLAGQFADLLALARRRVTRRTERDDA